MQNKFTGFFGVMLLAVTLGSFSVQPALAIDDPFGQGPGGNFDTSAGGGITNPLEGSADSATDVLKNVINWMLGLVGFLALIALVIGGTRMIMDFGKEEQVEKAKKTILWAVIGLAVVILSYAIINIVTSEILGAGGSGGKPYDTAPGGGVF